MDEDEAARNRTLRWLEFVCGFLVGLLYRGKAKDVAEAEWLSLHKGMVPLQLQLGQREILTSAMETIFGTGQCLELMRVMPAHIPAERLTPAQICKCGLPSRGRQMSEADLLALAAKVPPSAVGHFQTAAYCAQPHGRKCAHRQLLLELGPSALTCSQCGHLSRPNDTAVWSQLDVTERKVWCQCVQICQRCNLPRSSAKRRGHCSSSTGGEGSKCAKRARTLCALCKKPIIIASQHQLQRHLVPCPTCCEDVMPRVEDVACSAAGPAQTSAESESPLLQALGNISRNDENDEPPDDGSRAVCCRSLLIFGRPGTGKSTHTLSLVRKLREALPPGTVPLTAITGHLAQRIGGQTLHSWGGLKTAPKDQLVPECPTLEAKGEALLSVVSGSRRAMRAWQTARVLVIDDASMMGATLFDMLEYVARHVHPEGHARRTSFFGGITLVLNVDFHQLSPVGDKPLFNAVCWEALLNRAYMIELKTPHRFRRSTWRASFDDTDVHGVLDKVRIGCSEWQGYLPTFKDQLSVTLTPEQFQQAYHLFPTKSEAADFNQWKLNQITEQEATSYKLVLDDGSDFDSNHPRRTQVQKVLAKADISCDRLSCQLKEGIKVMYLENTQGKLMHGTLGIVVGFVGEPASYTAGSPLLKAFPRLPKVRWSSESFQPFEAVVQPMPLLVDDKHFAEANVPVFGMYGLPLQCAEALTIHKSQGLTCPFVVLDATNIFCPHQFYTAISRAPSFENLRVIGFNEVNMSKCINVHKRAAEWMRKLSARASNQNQEELQPFC